MAAASGATISAYSPRSCSQSPGLSAAGGLVRFGALGTLAAVRLFLMLLLVVPGLLLLATPGLPLGLLMIWAGWWVYERSNLSRRGDDKFIGLVVVLGGLGAAAVVLGAIL